MSNRYKTCDGGIDYDKAWRTLADLNDGYFGSVEGVSYQNASSVDSDSGVLGALDGGDEYVEPDVLGSKLLRTSSEMAGLLTKIRHGNEDEEHCLHVLKKHAVLASKLSDRYSMTDSHYNQQWHSDVLDICEAIQSADTN